MQGFKLLFMWGERVLDRIGDRNPQLLRELKGNLKVWPVAIAIAVTLLVQGVIMAGFWFELPRYVHESDWTLSTYPTIEWDWQDYQPLPFNLSDDFESMMATGKPAVVPLSPVSEEERISGPSIRAIHHYEAVRGEKTRNETDILDRLRRGDRLIAVNEYALTELEQLVDAPKPYDPENMHWRLSDAVDFQLYGGRANRQWSRDQASFLDEPVSLTLQRSGQEPYTVKLSRVAIISKHNSYCAETLENARGCDVSSDLRRYIVHWPKWYTDIFHTLTIALIFITMMAGTFLISQNLAHERRQGTLGFLRLSPRSCLTLFSGKLIGVPILLYGAIALTLPLLYFSGLQAGYGLEHLLVFTFIFIVQTSVFYLLAALVSVLSPRGLLLGFQPWLSAAGIGLFHLIVLLLVRDGFGFARPSTNAFVWTMLFSPFVSLAYVNLTDFFDMGGRNMAFGLFRINWLEYTVLVLLNALALGALLGHSLQRRFSTFKSTLLARQLSYPLTFVVMAGLLGLSQPYLLERYYQGTAEHLVTIVVLSVLYFTLLAIALSPDRQSLINWARCRDTQRFRSRRSLWLDMLGDDHSSPVLAIAFNLLIGVALFGVWLSPIDVMFYTPLELIFLMIGMVVGSILVAVLAEQTVGLLPSPKGWIWHSIAAGASGLIGPVSSFILHRTLAFRASDSAILMGMSAQQASFVLPLVGLSVLMVVLTVVHSRLLLLAGRSESQALFEQPPLSR